jgi:hypothetical protein
VPVTLDLPHPENFTICRACHRLQGRVTGRRDEPGRERVELVQSCDCVWAEGRRTGVFPERWPVRDFNEVWTLCHGCGAELLSSGSKWSTWLCERCKACVRRLHQVCGFAVVPIGRHSFMAGFGVPGGGPLRLRGRPRPDPAAIAQFADAVKRLGGRIERLSGWATKVVGLNLAERGLDGPEPVSLPRYLAALATPPVDRRRRFEGLGRHFEVPEALLELVLVLAARGR